MASLQQGARILVVDVHLHGHHSSYLVAIASALERSGWNVDFLLPDEDHANYSQVCRQLHETDPKIGIYPWQPSLVERNRNQVIGKGLFNYLEEVINSAIGRERLPHLVFLAWMDSFMPQSAKDSLFAFGVRLPFPYCGIWFQPRPWRAPMPFFKAWLLKFVPIILNKRCKGLLVLDEEIAPRMESFYRKPVGIFPDIADLTQSEEKETQDLILSIKLKAGGRKVVSLVGQLGKRKGVYQLRKICEKICPESFFFVLAGPWEPHFADHDFMDWCRSASENDNIPLFFREGFLAEGRLNAIIQASDYVWAWYPEFYYSSNVVTKAAAFRRPVLVHHQGLLKDRVERWKIGKVLNEVELESFFRSCPHQSDPEAELSAGYHAMHSHQTLQRRLDDFLGRI